MNKQTEMEQIEEMLLDSVFGERKSSSFYIEEFCPECGSNQAQTIDFLDGKGEHFECFSCGLKQKTVTT